MGQDIKLFQKRMLEQHGITVFPGCRLLEQTHVSCRAPALLCLFLHLWGDVESLSIICEHSPCQPEPRRNHCWKSRRGSSCGSRAKLDEGVRGVGGSWSPCPVPSPSMHLWPHRPPQNLHYSFRNEDRKNPSPERGTFSSIHDHAVNSPN